jgi:hypothetical protein
MWQLRFKIVLALLILVVGTVGQGGNYVRGQQAIGFIEKFATATDRRPLLEQLIPGTEDYFYYTALHHQTTGEVAEARSVLEAWRTKFGNTQPVNDMFARQELLEYATHPQQTLAYLTRELGLQLGHAPPSRDRAATLSNKFDNAQIELKQLIDQALAQDPSLSQLDNSALGLLLQRELNVVQLRGLLSRLDRADLPGTVEAIAKELALKDSAGFGWCGLHNMLTLAQLEQLEKLLPQLLENDNFVRAVTARLAPPEGASLSDKLELRTYLDRLHAWAKRLPPSQNSFKALVVGNLLRLDLSENKFDRARFVEYLKLPRSAVYYEPKKLINLGNALVQLNYAMQPQVPLPAMGDDSDLVIRYLEHFFQTDNSVNDFAPYLQREYLEHVFAQTKILYGLGEDATWYGKLTPAEQKELRERVELRFAPYNPHRFAVDDVVSLQVDLKNVEQLLVKIYEINLLNYYRNHTQPLGTDIDLDGLVPNQQRQLTFSQPAQRRHTEKIDFPEFVGRGSWVVDLLGGGQRSRALIHKGRLIALERLGDAGQVFEIIDETGSKLPTSHLELEGRKFLPDDQGRIIVPYSEQTVSRQVLLVIGDFASPLLITHHSEAYELQAGFLVDRQSLVAGAQASLAIRARLTCNGRPISLKLLEQAQLSIVATDADGVSSTQVVESLDLDDGDEWVHSFLVPQRLAQLSMTLSGRVLNRSRNERDTVSINYGLQCNGIQASAQIGDFFLRETTDGYRLLALGRNGEPIARLPVSLTLKLRQLNGPSNYTLATNADGEVDLGALDNVTQVTVSASDIQPASFSLERFHRNWPATVQLGINDTFELPLGKATAPREQFSLVEVRRGVPSANLNESLTVIDGALRIAALQPGDYLLHDYESGQHVRIAVGSAERRDHWVAAKNRLLQASPAQRVVIRQAAIVDGQLVVRVDGSDDMTRVHVIANGLLPSASRGQQLQLPHLPLAAQTLPADLSHYVESLRLDEDYSYILERQHAKKYPGNLLSQPSVLILPWEVSVTENERQDAAAGDAMPRSAAPPSPMSAMQAEAEGMVRGERSGWKSFDFLAKGQVLLANQTVVDGRFSVSVDKLQGCNSIAVVVVHPTSTDSRSVQQDAGALPVRDLRLREAFSPDVHLSQVQKVELLSAGEKKKLGDPRTRRLQAYSTVADVFQLYSTLLGNPEWEKFRFVGSWNTLSDEQRRTHYNEMACHELDFFLYHHDRPFFDRVVKPLLANKLDKQLVDRWLLGESLAEYEPLWRTQRLNTLERILLAERIDSRQAGTKRWLDEFLQAHPLSPTARQQRFEVALRGSALAAGGGASENLYFEAAQGYAMQAESLPEFDAAMGGAPRQSMADGVTELRRSRAMGRKARGGDAADKQKAEMAHESFSADRLGLAGKEIDGFYRSLDKTREWAETQYYHVRLNDQSAELVPPNAFWQEFLTSGGKRFLPHDLDLPTGSLNEALCALAVIDLPLARPRSTIAVENEQLVLESEAATVVFLESIEPTTEVQEQKTILVGQDIYLANPNTDQESNRPLGNNPLLRGIPYRANVVVTNPTSEKQRVQVLTQLPAGSLPLAGSKLTRSTPVELAPYSTSQVQYVFYFPAAGEFAHYGAQISAEESHIADTAAAKHRVLDEPESVDQTTWNYIADWGTDAQVLEFLQTANLERIDLSRIAFRLKHQAFYSQVTELLAASGRYEPNLWAYAVAHNDRDGIAELLYHRPDFIARLGSTFASPLVDIDPRQQMSYEHLDYKPLVVARIHRLGREPVILNPSLHRQYTALLDVIAHQPRVTNDQRLQLCYYLLLQNRIEEALTWFGQVEKEPLATHLQYDYFDAYLDFYRGQVDRAAKIANQYAEYPVPRWAEMFSQIRQQVDQHSRLLAGSGAGPSSGPPASNTQEQGLLTDAREQQMAAQAAAAVALDLEVRDGSVSLRYRNLDAVQVNYYLMDIELLFSRNPFVSQASDQVPAIRPNLSETVKLDASDSVSALELPEAMRNRNVLVEVTAAGISRSTWLTASSLLVSLAEPAGRLQVLSQSGRLPVSAAYVKVFARHQDGSVRFFKDGYTDLNGNFDYTSLSTSDLDNTQRLAILVLDEKLGAVVREANPPTR